MRVKLIELERYWVETPIFMLIVIVIIGISFIVKFNRTNTSLKDFIISHYEKDGIKVVKISSLSINEKARYGMPPFDIYSAKNFFPNFLEVTSIYNRRVELIENENTETTKYLEITIRGKYIVDYNEFDSYDI